MTHEHKTQLYFMHLHIHFAFKESKYATMNLLVSIIDPVDTKSTYI
jgi:hypothetical protein